MGVYRMGRLNEHNASFVAQLGQGRAQQGDFTDARTLEGKFYQRPYRPAFARQFGIKPAKAG